MTDTYTDTAHIFTDITLEIFRLSGALIDEGDRLTSDLGLTSARWKVLGAIDVATTPLTVPQIARRMGLARQSVQRIVDQMRPMGLVEVVHNPDHLRSPMVRHTPEGKAIYQKIMRRYIKWANQLAANLETDELKKTLEGLRKMTQRLNEVPYYPSLEDGPDNRT